MHPIIIEAAINGGTTRERNPRVPIGPEEIAEDALRCIAAGASIIHNHIEDLSLTGSRAADRYLEGWRRILIERPDAILCPTAAHGETAQLRFAHWAPLAAVGAARMGALDPGSVNLAMTGSYGLPGDRQTVYANSFADIDQSLRALERQRLGPSLAIYEPGFLRAALAYHRAGRLPPGTLIKLYFGGDYNPLDGIRGGITFGLPPTRLALDAYMEILGDCPLPWAVAVLGGDVTACGMTRLAIERGGHVRIGIEDYAGPGQPSNVDLVKQVAELAAPAGRPVADCATAARLLDLPRR